MIAVLQFGLVVALSVFRFRWAICIFVFFLAFAPRSLGYVTSGGNLSLTFIRIAFPVLVVLLILARWQKNPSRDPNFIQAPPIFSLQPFRILISLSALKIITTLLNDRLPVYAVDELIFSSIAFAFFYFYSSERVYRNLIQVMLVSVFVCGIVVVLENMARQPLHYAFADQSLLTEGVIRIRDRSGVYRAQGFFDNPLLLSEFAVYSLPLALYTFNNTSALMQKISFLSIIIIIYLIYSSGSRSGIICFIIVIISFFTIYKWNYFDKLTKRLFVFLITLVFLYVVFFSSGILLALIQEARIAEFYLINDAARVSTLGRALQYFEVYNALVERPLTGFGVLQNFSNELSEIHRIDSYFLRVGLEAGVLGVILFAAFLLSLFQLINRYARTIGLAKTDRLFHAMCVSLLAGFATKKLFLSMPTNNIYFYLLISTFLAVLARRALLKSYNYAYPTGPQ